MRTLTLTPPSHPLSAHVAIPGSKSYTNRALLLAAQAHGISRLSSVSMSADSEAMVTALRQLGLSVHESKEGDETTLLVEGRGGAFLPCHGVIDVGPAGTTMRFLTALCAAIPGSDVELRGTERMHQRPIGDLVDALRALGAEIHYLGKDGHPPLRIASKKALHGGAVSMNGSVSSQFITALLLTAPLNSRPLSIKLLGEQISKSYIDMTIQSVGDFGVAIRNDSYRSYTSPEGARFSARSYPIEGDASGASYLWGLAAVSGGSVTVENINPESAQGDVHFPELLRRMGCTVTMSERSITVAGAPRLRGFEADMSNMPDTAQTLAVIAATAEGATKITGLSTLRVKETDRIAALHTELAKVGIRSEAGPDYLVVHGGTPHGAQIATYEDHRMAMSFAMLGAIVSGMRIEEPEVVNKSFPTFWKVLESIGICHS
jgi:3-phosphoshikimate 1-carboxyvinyltransferase